MRTCKVLLLVIVILSYSYSQECIRAIGIGIDKSREEAIKKAKLEAVNSVSGVKLKSETIIERIIEDKKVNKDFYYIIYQEVSGFVKDFSVIEENYDGKFYKVKIEACVFTEKLKDMLNEFSKNTGVFVKIEHKNKLPSNILENSITEELLRQGFNVFKCSDRDISKGGIYIIGELSLKIDSKKPDISVVYAKVDYRIEKKGYSEKILYINTVIGKGVDSNLEIAKEEAVKSVSKELREDIISAIYSMLNGESIIAILNVGGYIPVRYNLEIKKELSKIPFVNDVEIIGNGVFKVFYSGKYIELARSVERKLGFKLKEISPPYLIFHIPY